MTKYEIKCLIEVLQDHLNESDKMWDNKLPHAQIIGYLQGTVKGIIGHLESNVKK
jgi:hypothetical protein